MQLIRTLASWRPDVTACRNIQDAYRIALKSLARRYLELHDEIPDLDVMITSIVDELAPELIKRKAVGYECASQLLITAGDNPQRLNSESGFAALCGVSPVPVSSGKTNRHRLNRGGDRAAVSAFLKESNMEILIYVCDSNERTILNYAGVDEIVWFKSRS